MNHMNNTTTIDIVHLRHHIELKSTTSDRPVEVLDPNRIILGCVATIEDGQKVVNAIVDCGLTFDQATTVTGFGLRRLRGCKPADTIANKYAAGALSIVGIRNLIADGHL